VPTLLRSLFLGVLFAVGHGPGASAFLPRESVEVSVEIILNAVDESPRSACKAAGRAALRWTHDWSVAVAAATPHPENGSDGTGRQLRCGADVSRPQSDSGDEPGSPYLIGTGSTVARLIRQMEDEQLLEVNLDVSLQKLSGFDSAGEPVYEQSEVKRSFYFAEAGQVLTPLLVATGVEESASGIHEVFVKVAARVVTQASGTAYGTIWVTDGIDAAALLLDGGVVANLPADGEAMLRNVRVGFREVRARDDAGHEVRKLVNVVPDRTVLVDLSLPEPAQDVSPFGLVSLGKNAHGHESYRRGTDGAVVVKIPAGEFLMGNRETERTPFEHRVYVSEFLIDRTGVTWGQFKQFAEASGIPLPPHEPYWGIHDDHPMVYVTWDEANAYCSWAGARLPTEAEREKAARGTDERKYPWGNEEPDPERAVFRRSWGKEATAAVGTHPAGASPYGAMDMGGNVWEWCADWYDADYYEVSPHRDPKGPPYGTSHVVRGGSWDSRPAVLSASCRSWGHRGYRDGDFGFRCAMHAPR
jgi:formylglycine-generating enzyme required for sulfatase activity